MNLKKQVLRHNLLVFLLAHSTLIYIQEHHFYQAVLSVVTRVGHEEIMLSCVHFPRGQL